MPGKPSPGEGRGIRAAAPRLPSDDEQREIDGRVCQKTIDHVAHPVRRPFQSYLPEILAICATDSLLRHKDSRKPYDENAHVQSPVIFPRGSSMQRSNMDPQT